MSISGISSNGLIDSSHQNVHNNLRRFRQEFQQLGSDLQNGPLSAARQDFSTLRGLAEHGKSGSSTSSSTSSSSPVVQTFKHLGQDLQSGSISDAHRDYTTLKQDFQKIAQSHHHHRHHVHDAGAASPGADPSGITLQSGDASSAQAAYNSLLDFQQFGQGASLIPEFSPSGVSVSA
jgi:hypothetical protein